MAVTAERLTAEQYLALPLDRRTQLIDGEVVVNSPTWDHQRISGLVYFRLRLWVEAAPGRGAASIPVDVVLSLAEPSAADQVYAPDVLWVDEAHLPPPGTAHLVGPPQLAVEVRSPSTWRFDVGRKKQVYEATGLAELWLVDTASESVLVYRRSSPASARFDIALELGGAAELTSPPLDGFALGVAELFDR